MTLPKDFLFSQSSLQDYVDCQRRFQLRHIHHLSWPAVEAEPYIENERMIDQGARFHKIVRQYLIGVPEAQIAQTNNGDEVMELDWINFLHSVKDGNLEIILEQGNQHLEEITLSVPLGEFRLIAKYDLLIIRPDSKLIILDWKTSQNHPKRKWLADRLQTHVYPYVLTGASPGLTGGYPLDPAQIEMIYWFTNQPDQPEAFPYNSLNYQEDSRYLSNLITTIAQKIEPIFPLTPDVKRCLFCTYRSLCNRGVKPGDLQHMNEWLEPESPEEVTIDFDQIGEIGF
ncbi:MAG: PD-(D/E)XK nuclease family protein [Anaerolineales bacterium]